MLEDVFSMDDNRLGLGNLLHCTYTCWFVSEAEVNFSGTKCHHQLSRH